MLLTRTSNAARILATALLALPLSAAALQVTKPEDVGLSSDRLKRINEMIDRRIAAGDISGAVTLVARRGRVVHFEAQGLANLDAKKPMAKDAVFRLASMSKPVTGVAIMMLVEEGRIRLTDPVSRYIPEFRGLKVAVVQPARGGAANAQAAPQFYTVPADREITIRDLLSHVSGLVSGPISTAEAAKVARKPGETLADYIPRLASVPLEFQPGSRWSYSPGAGFDTLGRVVEVVSGQTFDAFLRQRIFNPLEMKDIGFNATAAMAPRQATIYQKRDGKLQVSANAAANGQPNVYFSGAGGLMSSTEDYLPLGQMLVNGGQLNGKRLLSPRTVDMMASPHAPDSLPGRTPGQSFGLSVRLVSDHVKAVSALSDGSFGWSGAQGTHFWVDPKEKIVAILMVQTSIGEMQRDFEEAVMQSIIE
jgi:CubicO group peptidase (beta-lactamase class C family)